MLRALPCLEDVPLLLDGMDDSFLAQMAAWPIRFYGARRGALEVIGEPREAQFDLAPLREWLLEWARPALA